MSSRDRRQAACLITWRKVTAARIFVVLFGGFVALLGWLWLSDSFSLALRTFLFFFPYLFLFLSQDMYRDEIDSGALENVIFLQDGFRDYLRAKCLILAAIGLAASLSVFLVLGACGLSLGRFSTGHVLRFAVGLIAGLYYLLVGGCLSFFLKGGSNVLVIIIGQVFLGIGLFLSMTARRGWVESLLAGSLPDLISRLRLLAVALVFPNFAVVKPLPYVVPGIILAGLGVFWFGRRRISRLELFRR
jgi:hypothetical protein